MRLKHIALIVILVTILKVTGIGDMVIDLISDPGAVVPSVEIGP